MRYQPIKAWELDTGSIKASSKKRNDVESHVRVNHMIHDAEYSAQLESYRKREMKHTIPQLTLPLARRHHIESTILQDPTRSGPVG